MLNRARSWIDDILRVVGAWTLVSAAGGAAVLTLVQKYWPQYAPFVLAAVVGFLAVVVFVAVMRILRWQQEESGDWDDATLQRTVRDWVDSMGTVTKMADPVALFNYQVEKTSPVIVMNIARVKAQPKYIVILSGLSLSGDHAAKFTALAIDAKRALLAELRIEVSRLGMGWDGFAVPLDKMRIVQQVPVTSHFSEHDFSLAVQRVINATILIRQVIQWRLGTGGELDASPQKVSALESPAATAIPSSDQ
jgi:hypothetical protein